MAEYRSLYDLATQMPTQADNLDFMLRNGEIPPQLYYDKRSLNMLGGRGDLNAIDPQRYLVENYWRFLQPEKI